MGDYHEPWTYYESLGDGCLEDGQHEVILCRLDLVLARRIAACVNACVGIPTEVLERDDVQQGIQALGRRMPHGNGGVAQRSAADPDDLPLTG